MVQILLMLLSYVLGSVPTGVLAGRAFRHRDSSADRTPRSSVNPIAVASSIDLHHLYITQSAMLRNGVQAGEENPA